MTIADGYVVDATADNRFEVVPASTGYTVTFKNWDGTVLQKTAGLAEGALISYDGETPTKAADSHTYTFAGWTDGTNTYGVDDKLPEVSAKTGNVTYSAVFTTNHTFGYKADGATVTEGCTVDGCDVEPLVLTIVAPEHATYGDGKAAYDKVVASGSDAIAQAADADAVARALAEAKDAVDATARRIEQGKAAAKAHADARADAEAAKAAAQKAADDPLATEADKAAIDDAAKALDVALDEAAKLGEDATPQQKADAAKAVEDAAVALASATGDADARSAKARSEVEGLDAAKSYAADRLADHADAKAPENMTKAEKAAYEKVAAEGKDAIEGARDTDAVASALKKGKKAIDDAAKKVEKDRATKAALKRTKVKASVKTAKKQLAVTWTKVGAAKKYQIRWRVAGGKWKTKSVKASKTTCTIKGLKYGKAYDVRVRAVAGKITGKWSAIKRRLLAGRKIKVASKSAGTARVSWAKLKGASGYQVFWSTKPSMAGKKSANVAAGKKSYTIKGLPSGKRVYVKIRPIAKRGGKTYVGATNAKAKSAKVK